VETLVIAAIAALVALSSMASLLLAFAGTEGPGRILFGKAVSPTITLPLASIGAMIALLGIWQRENWGCIAGFIVFGATTLFFAVRLGQGEMTAGGIAAAVALILLIFNRLSGRRE